MLEIRGLNYSYDNSKNVLNNINFTIEEGKVYCLLGENGAGKTTLFKCLNGEIKCNLNKIACNDEILFIHDEMKFYYYLTGKEYISLIMNLKSRNFNKEYYEYLLCKLKMDDKINSKIFSYSLGMKHKLVLITAFLLDYKYILMDEPFTALDYISLTP
ncbi:ATP-binding cassette domain-containing protein [Clostridium pasteurianum]|uniref:ATP-binding cassette domain-containing protein n=1 Tax=Clostridium pasteurianum TaxID=1501 RepID=UPI002260B564|nr:ATP-binding cassette domain-containing protein [Clostridium pasteurianum]UZW15563.1 ATP-binding cassette domain-containing protein [Clostridium pasteurianum]